EFKYRADDARAAETLRPGWLLLCREGHEFECAHEHAGGDDCTVFDLPLALLEDVARSVSGARAIFSRAVMPPVPGVAARLHLALRAAEAGADFDVDEAGAEAAAAVLEALAGARLRPAKRVVADDERVRAAVEALDVRCDEPWSLGEIAEHVGASPFH